MASTATTFSKKSIVCITGASKGIGQTIAIELARHLNQNSIFVLLARNQQGLEETKKRIVEVDKALTVLTFVVDLSKPDFDSYIKFFDKVVTTVNTKGIEFGYMFHNAGHVGVLKETTELNDLKVWQDYFNLNMFSTVLLNNAFLQKIRPVAPQLFVINITSLVGRVPFQNMSMYGAGKAAREIFFKVVAAEQPNVIVLNYSPGPVLTDMFNSICDDADNVKLRQDFREVRDNKALTTDQTVGKLLSILEKGDYKSGDTIDYFDRM